MSKMAEKDQSIKDMKQWIKRNITYIILVTAILANVQSNIERKRIFEKETRINNIEERLTKQENYMHQVEADIDNLYRSVE